jgi:hypothetical protein
MKRLSFFSMLLAIACPGWVQQAVMTPMGVVVTPHSPLQVSQELRSLLPKDAAVRLLQPTTMAEAGEEVVIYETANRIEPSPHLAVVKNGARVADFSLAGLFQQDGAGDNYTLFKAAEFEGGDKKKAFIAAFRSIGDGSGTIFVLLTERDHRYVVAWKKETTQGRFKALRNGQFEVWDADGEGQCVWCPQHYKVSTFEWKDGKPVIVSRYTTKHALDPVSISGDPIVIEK